jgi:hypothetical protein
MPLQVTCSVLDLGCSCGEDGDDEEGGRDKSRD